MNTSAECGVRSAELETVTPNSKLRIPNFLRKGMS